MRRIKKGLLLVVGLIFLQFTTDHGEALPQNAEDISPLLIGENAPEVEVKNLNNASVLFTDIVKKQPSVVLFYRGGWCPYCNAHLSAVGQVEEEVQKLGYQIVGVSPDDIEHLKGTMEKQALHYQLYSDSEGELIRAMGIAFQAAERHKDRLLKYSDNKNKGMLPVPSLFVIDKNGTIVFEYISPDYKHRMSAEMLLAVLKSLHVSD